jgi:ankyrin repeat protein
MLACKMGLTQIAELLLNNQVNIHETNVLGETALKLAQKSGHEDLVLLLIQKYKALVRQPSRK